MTHLKPRGESAPPLHTSPPPRLAVMEGSLGEDAGPEHTFCAAR